MNTTRTTTRTETPVPTTPTDDTGSTSSPSTSSSQTSSQDAPKATITLVSSRTVRCKTGEVVVIEVGSTRRPTIETSDNCPKLLVSRTPDGTWAASWVPMTEGKHTLTATAGDADPVTVTVTATDPEED